MKVNVFTYGTLMFKPVWIKVTGIFYKSQKARIYGFSRKSVTGQQYPVLVPAGKDQTVKGVLYLDVSEPVLKKLDSFEGSAYLRQKVEVEINNKRKVTAHTYVLKKEYYSVIDESEWDPQFFKKMYMMTFPGND
jgi:gamma-glutamylcyclotransferase (GGCT)/AIG2-like uncharacterized protein YtfP